MSGCIPFLLIANGYQCAVKLSNKQTSFFSSDLGVKQGSLLSPMLFDLFINSLAEEINAIGVGATYGENKIGVLLYADDVILMADSAEDLQILLNTLHSWCYIWS